MKRTTLTLLIVVVGTLAVAVTGLVVEDVLPVQSSKALPSWAILRNGWLRPALAAGGVALLVLLVWRRTRLSQLEGTFYYVRFLDGWMTDRHLDEERQRRKAHLDERVVVRQLVSTPRGGVIDVADDLQVVARDLQQTMNEDDVSTGFTVAPNLLWPMSLGLGYTLFAWPGLKLQELSGREDQRMRWALEGDWKATSPGFVTPVVETEGPGAREPVRTVVVLAELSGQGKVTLPDDLTADVVLRVTTPTTERKAGRKAHVTPENRRSRPKQLRRGSDITAVHPRAAVDVTAGAIRHAIHCWPEARVYVILRVPKTVAVAIGRSLGGPCTEGADEHSCRLPRCRNPWSALVPLLRDQTADGDAYHAVRVNPAQPLPEHISAAARERGVILSGGAPSPANDPLEPIAFPFEVVNLTPHVVRVLREDVEVASFPSEGFARVSERPVAHSVLQTTAGTVPTVSLRYGDEVDGLPPPRPGTLFVVSRIVAAAVEREDLLFPADEVRDPSGTIIGCSRLGQFIHTTTTSEA